MLSPRTVLIIDDSLEDCATFNRYLMNASEQSYRIVEAHSGKEALECLQIETPDCILLDSSLLDTDSAGLLASFKNERRLSRFPVVMLTGSGSNAATVSDMQNGVFDHLLKKTLTAEALLRSLNNAIDKHVLLRQVEAQRVEAERRNAELEAANEALRQSEAQITLGVQVGELGLATVDYDTGLNTLSSQAARLFGLGEAMMTVPRETVHSVFHSEDRTELMQQIAESLDPQGAGWFAMVHRVVWPNGEVRWLRVRKQVFFEGEGKARHPVRAILAALDVTAEKNTADALKESRLRYQHLLNSSPVAIFSCTPGGDYRATYVSENVESLLGYTPRQLSEGAFWSSRVHQEDRKRLFTELPQIFERGSHSHDYRFQMEDGSYCWVQNELTLVRDAEGQPVEIVGALQDISARKEAEERLRLALEAGKAGTFLHDLITDQVEWSVHLEQIAGFEPGKFGGTFTDFLNLIHPEDKDSMAAIIQDAIARCEEYQFEFRLVSMGGKIVWLAGRGRAYARKGIEVDTITGVAFDITKRKEAEERLQASSHFLQSITNVIPSIIHIFDLNEKRSVYMNRTVAATIGYRPDEVKAMGAEVISNLMHPEDQPRFGEHLARVQTLKDQEVVDFEYRIHDREGKWHWFHSRDAVFLRDEDGRVRQLIGTATEITERREAEEKQGESEQKMRAAYDTFRHSEERLRYSLQASSAGSWDWDIVTGEIVWSPENHKLYDIDIAQGSPHYSDWESRVHPEDRDTANQTVQDVLDGRVPEFRTEFRIVNRQGEVRWLLGLGNVERNAQGVAVRMSGINLDITERKLQQQEIAELNERLHRAVFEGSHRIKNHLQVLSAMVDMQVSDSTHVPVEELQRIKNHIQALAAIHDVMTLTTKENAENDVLPVKPLLDRLLPLLQYSGGTHRMSFEVDDALLSAKQASSLVLILNELVSNAVKHGKSEINLTFHVEAKMGILEVCDDGNGFPVGFDARKAANTGLDIVGGIARVDLRGQVVYDNHAEGGGRVTVTFPLQRTRA